MPPAVVFKICPEAAWREAQASGVYRGSADDKRDGFIHFSASDQLAGTLAKHFAGQSGLLLLAVDASVLGPSLKWEPSRGGALFPHLYGDLGIAAVRSVVPIALRADGSHLLPELVA